MLITTMFAMALVAAPEPVDVKTARSDFSSCLRAFAEQSVKDKMTLDAFKAALPNQCTTQAEAYRLAMLANDKQYGISAKESRSNFDQEVSDYHDQFVDFFQSVTDH